SATLGSLFHPLETTAGRGISSFTVDTIPATLRMWKLSISHQTVYTGLGRRPIAVSLRRPLPNRRRVVVAFREFQTDALPPRFCRKTAFDGSGLAHQRAARRAQRRPLWTARSAPDAKRLGHPFFPSVGV